MKTLYAIFYKDTKRPFGVFTSMEEAEFEKTLIDKEGRPSEIIEIPTLDLLTLKIEAAYNGWKAIPSPNS